MTKRLPSPCCASGQAGSTVPTAPPPPADGIRAAETVLRIQAATAPRTRARCIGGSRRSSSRSRGPCPMRCVPGRRPDRGQRCTPASAHRPDAARSPAGGRRRSLSAASRGRRPHAHASARTRLNAPNPTAPVPMDGGGGRHRDLWHSEPRQAEPGRSMSSPTSTWRCIGRREVAQRATRADLVLGRDPP